MRRGVLVTRFVPGPAPRFLRFWPSPPFPSFSHVSIFRKKVKQRNKRVEGWYKYARISKLQLFLFLFQFDLLSETTFKLKREKCLSFTNLRFSFTCFKLKQASGNKLKRRINTGVAADSLPLFHLFQKFHQLSIFCFCVKNRAAFRQSRNNKKK